MRNSKLNESCPLPNPYGRHGGGGELDLFSRGLGKRRMLVCIEDRKATAPVLNQSNQSNQFSRSSHHSSHLVLSHEMTLLWSRSSQFSPTWAIYWTDVIAILKCNVQYTEYNIQCTRGPVLEIVTVRMTSECYLQGWAIVPRRKEHFPSTLGLSISARADPGKSRIQNLAI